MNKGELIYLKMSNGDRVFLNMNEIVSIVANRITMDNSDDDDISIETPGIDLEIYMRDKSHYEYTFADGDPYGTAVLRQFKNFVSEEAFV
mgnify:FL=1